MTAVPFSPCPNDPAVPRFFAILESSLRSSYLIIKIIVELVKARTHTMFLAD